MCAAPRRSRLAKAPGDYHHGNLKDALVSAAEREVARTGDVDLSLRELARALGVSHAAAYRHFESKVGLQAEVARRGYLALTRALRDARANGRDAAGRVDVAVTALQSIGLAYVDFALEHPGAFRLMFDRALKPFTAHPELATAAGEAFAELAGAVIAALPSSRPAQRRRERLTHALWSLVHGHATLVLAEQLSGPLSIDAHNGSDAIRDAIELLVRGSWQDSDT